MTGNLLEPGDVIDVVVSRTTPFGLLVESAAGPAGLVRGAVADVGARVRVRVIEYDAVESRFNAAPVT